MLEALALITLLGESIAAISQSQLVKPQTTRWPAAVAASIVLPAPDSAATDSVRAATSAADTDGAHQRTRQPWQMFAACTLSKSRSTAASVTYVCVAGVPLAVFTTASERRMVSVSTYTVPGAAGP